MISPVILPYRGVTPTIHPTAWIAPGAIIVGDTVIGAESSVWFGCIVRGDVNTIRIGSKVNLQDGVICHVTIARAPLEMQDSVSVAHGAILHGCTLETGCLIGIGARVLDRAVIGRGSMIAAGAVVKEQAVVPPGELWAGVPAKKKRDLTPEEIRSFLDTAERYVRYKQHYQGKEAEIPEQWLPAEKTVR